MSEIKVLEHYDFDFNTRGMYLTQAMLSKMGGQDALRELFRETHDGADPIDIRDDIGEYAWIETGTSREAKFEDVFVKKLKKILGE
ncbi:MAG TPA: hypothetical protein VJB60_04395 [Candidatus Peribacterales bacterium]|nr:hypothetical protein [Candidatus Peribacterales bacterium]